MDEAFFRYADCTLANYNDAFAAEFPGAAVGQP